MARTIPRGTVMGERVGGPPLSEAEHFWKCEACGGWFDMRDLGALLDHEEPLPHPASHIDGVSNVAFNRWKNGNDRADFMVVDCIIDLLANRKLRHRKLPLESLTRSHHQLNHNGSIGGPSSILAIRLQ
jgi:hypothetical protein